MRKLTVLVCLAVVVAACGNQGAAADSSTLESSAPQTTGLSASDQAFNAEVLGRFRIVDISGINLGALDNEGHTQDILQPISPAEAAVQYICGDGPPDGYTVVFGFGPAGAPPNGATLIQDFQAYAIETYCP